VDKESRPEEPDEEVATQTLDPQTDTYLT